MANGFANVEPEFAALWEAALMVLEDNARRDARTVDSEKLAVALIATEEE